MSRRALLLAVLLGAPAAACSANPPAGAHSDGGAPVAEGGAGDVEDAGAGPVVYGPHLTELAIRGASGPLPLVPSFSAATHDYYVQCPAEANAVTVSIAASAGAMGALTAPVRSRRARTQKLALELDANAAVVATVADASESVDYWVRCLPPDFPTLRMRHHASAGSVTPGYYLVGLATVPTGKAGYAMILDTNGVPVWYYRHPQGDGFYDVDDVIPGAVSFLPEDNGDPFEVHYLSLSVVTTIPAYDGHELRVLPNGNYVFIESPQINVDLSGLVNPIADGGTQAFGPNSPIWTCEIHEVDPTGRTVWLWKATDHFDPVKDMTYLQWPIVSDGKQVIEPFHCNSVDIDSMGNLLVSARDMDTVFYVERPSGTVLWKMGGSTYSKDKATYVPVEDKFFRQHDARFLPSWKPTCRGGSGQISVFDDESGKPGPARAAIYDVVVDLDGGVDAGCGATAAGPTGAKLAWQYMGSGTTPGTGSFRILPDGSRTIGWGQNLPLAFSEVTEDGRDLLDFAFPDGTSTYRAVKVPPTAFDLDVLRATAGK